MEVLLMMVVRLTHNWIILCPSDKKQHLEDVIFRNKASCKQAREAYLSGKLGKSLVAHLPSHPNDDLEDIPKDLLDLLMKNSAMNDMADAVVTGNSRGWELGY